MNLIITKSQFYELSELDEKGMVIWTSLFDTLEEANQREEKIGLPIIINNIYLNKYATKIISSKTTRESLYSSPKGGNIPKS
jgi:hypothetical protein